MDKISKIKQKCIEHSNNLNLKSQNTNVHDDEDQQFLLNAAEYLSKCAIELSKIKYVED